MAQIHADLSLVGIGHGFSKIDGFVRSQKTLFSVIPVKTGIQEIQEVLDSRLRGSDDYVHLAMQTLAVRLTVPPVEPVRTYTSK